MSDPLPLSPNTSSSPTSTSTAALPSSTTNTTTATTENAFSPPASVLIVGSGVFGLSTAYALARRPGFEGTSITVVDRAAEADASGAEQQVLFPSRDASSIDTSRIIRADYADPAYAALAAEALVQWRKLGDGAELGDQGRYTESGLVLVADDIAAPSHEADAPSKPSAVPASGEAAKKTGAEYVKASRENVAHLTTADPSLAGVKIDDVVRFLPDREAIVAAVGNGGGASGDWGYVNRLAGWADADASMRWLLERVRATGRVRFVSGTVASLQVDSNNNIITGALLTDGRVLSADLTVVAAGAWTGSLVDLAGRAVATGQVLGYMDITEEEQAALAKMPVLLNMTTGLFVIPPVNRVLKVARHAYGYLNPTTLSLAPLPPSTEEQQQQQPPSSSSPTVVSLPLTHLTEPDLSIPEEGSSSLRAALREMVPLPALHDRAFTRTRVCWYTDTPTGDFLIDYHPGWAGLFVATGGSGHGFKFLPVIGERILDCIARDRPASLADKWAWKPSVVSRRWDAVATEDGSRGGKPGLILREELSKTRTG